MVCAGGREKVIAGGSKVWCMDSVATLFLAQGGLAGSDRLAMELPRNSWSTRWPCVKAFSAFNRGSVCNRAGVTGSLSHLGDLCGARAGCSVTASHGYGAR